VGDERRTLTENEDDDYDDQHASYLVLCAVVRRLFLGGVTAMASRPPRVTLLARVAQRRHQLVVENDERHERNEKHDQEVHHRRVDNLHRQTVLY